MKASFLRLCIALPLLLAMPVAEAVTYVNAATTYNWIDATSHTKVGAHTAPYQFRSSLGGCGTTAPVIDDTLSDVIPIGFNFVFGDKVFDSVRLMSNGRIHLVSTTIPLDNTTCGYGSPVTQIPYPDGSLTYSMRIYGNDMDPTLQADYGSATPCVSINSCFISIASIGTAPNRQFVVTWNNVPEWASFTSATGNYNLQMILNEDGSFIYQYGTDVPGPQAALGQVGWEISTSDYDTPAVGYPVPNTAIRFFVPHPVAEYLMEQASWSGSGSVLDTSGSSQHGTPLGAAQTVAAGKVCRGASIPSSATGANAINSNISVPASIGNSGTIAFWYKSNTAWTGSDVLLLDATTTNNRWFFLTRRGGGRLRFTITDSTGANRVVETGVITVAANTWKHIAVTWNFNNLAASNNDLLTIYVDGVQQAQTTFTSTTTTLSAQIGSLYIGGSRNSLTGPSSTVSSADGTIDEFRAYNYEAKTAFITTEMNLNTGGCLNHYAITDAGTGLTCQLSQVTIAAHTGSHGAFVNNTLVTLTTSDGTGTWSLLNGHGFLTNVGTNTGTATYLYNNESQVILGLTHATAATVTMHVTDGSFAENENTPLVISECVVGKFNACEVTATRCVPIATSAPTPPAHGSYAYLYTKLASTAFALDVVAVKADGTLDTSFNKTVSVNLLANTYVPTINASNNCPTSQTATIPLGTTTLTSGRPPVGGLSVSTTAFSSVSPNYRAYRDVRVQFVCSAANCGTAGTWCATDAFAVRPLSYSSISSSANADSNGLSTSASPAIKAGANITVPFTFTLTANTGTPGYDGFPQVDTSKAEWLNPPSGGIPYNPTPTPPTLPTFGTGTVSGTFAAATLSTGNGTVGSLSYSEVGYFRLQAGGVYDGEYVGASGDGGRDCINTPPNDFSNTLVGGKYGCKIANQSATNYFGRFIPDHFETAINVVSGVPMCLTSLLCPPVNIGLVYSGQPFTTQVTAKSLAGNTTLNYSGIPSYAFTHAVTLAAWDAPGSTTTQNPAGLLTNTNIANTRFIGGVATPGTLPVYTLSTTPTAPTNIFLRATESAGGDSVTSLQAIPSNSVEAGVTAISGRIKVSSAFGSELLPLSLQAIVQYWNGTNWVNSSTDSITSFNTSTDLVKVIVKGPLTTGKISVVGAGSVTVTGGVKAFTLAAPGAGFSGSANISLSAPSYLMTGSNGAAVNPSIPGTATFGIYKGNNPFIYRRESY